MKKFLLMLAAAALTSSAMLAQTNVNNATVEEPDRVQLKATMSKNPSGTDIATGMDKPQVVKHECKDHKDGQACNKPADQQCPDCKAKAEKKDGCKEGMKDCKKAEGMKHECKDGKKCEKAEGMKHECKDGKKCEKAQGMKLESKKDNKFQKADKVGMKKIEGQKCEKAESKKCEKAEGMKHECKDHKDGKCDKPADQQCPDCKAKAEKKD